MKQYQFKKYELSATATRGKDATLIYGTFGPFRFEVEATECDDCHHYIANHTHVWCENEGKGKRAGFNAIPAIEYRLSQVQAVALKVGEEQQISF